MCALPRFATMDSFLALSGKARLLGAVGDS